MSVKQMSRVWELDLGYAQRLVLLALADHAHDDGGGVRPAVGLVAWKTGYSVRSVKRIMGALREAGLLETVRRGGGDFASLYRLRLDRGKAKQPYRMLESDAEGAKLAPVPNAAPEMHESGKTSAAFDTLIISPRTINQEPSVKTLVPHAPTEIVRTPDGTLQVVPSLLKQWQERFPLVDVPGWLGFIEEYAHARPTWAHKRRNWRLTILRWLRVEQERATAKGLTRPGQDETLAQRKEELRRMLRPKEAARA